MISSFWNDCANTLGLTRQPAKRISQSRQWGMASELLETRNMLSATSLIAPEAAEVAGARARFVAPNVAGTWDVTIDGIGETTATITQTKSKVTIAVDLPGIGDIELKGRFTRSNDHAFSGTARVNLPELGRVKIAYNFAFSAGELPDSFDGSASLTGRDLPQSLEYSFVGAKQELMNGSRTVERAVEFPNVSGDWELTLNSDGVEVATVLTISQSGPGGKRVIGVAETATGSVVFKGNLKKNSAELKGAVLITPESGRPIRGKFEVIFSENFTTFTGGAAVKKLDQTVALDGVKILN